MSVALPSDTKRFFGSQCVLVTGCTGFIGGILSETLLGTGARVVGLSRGSVEAGSEKVCYLTHSGLHSHDRMTLVRGDLQDREFVATTLSKYPVDSVFHFAGEAILGKEGGADAYALNTVATENLLLAIEEHRPGTAFLLASTDMVYGPGSAQPSAETMSPQPHNFYARSKFESEALVSRSVQQGGLRAGIVRLSNVYGGGDMNFSRLLPGLVRDILAGNPPTLRSDGQSIRDFVHVNDVVTACLTFCKALNRGELNGEIYNVASGRSVRVIDLVTELLKAGRCEERTPILGTPDPRSDWQRHLCISKARAELDWAPEMNLPSGIAQTLDWYKNAGFISAEAANKEVKGEALDAKAVR